MKAGNKIKGFTLIELMTVVAIIAVLTAIVFPAYRSYLVQGSRTDVQSTMSQIAQRLAAYKLSNGDYGATNSTAGYKTNPLTNPAIYGGTKYPQTGQQYYDLAITASPSTTWVLTATPIAGGRQKGDGIVVLNNDGQRCWVKASTVACVPTATSNWDGK